MPRVVRHKIIARVSQRPRDVQVLRPNAHHVVTVQQLPCDDGRKSYKRCTLQSTTTSLENIASDPPTDGNCESQLDNDGRHDTIGGIFLPDT